VASRDARADSFAIPRIIPIGIWTYDAAVAALADERTYDFLRTHLGD
jgi:hypothetical protein